MKQIHFILQGKGGVGKSFIASLLAQYLRDRKKDQVVCFDTDPVNPTLSRYKQLNVQTIPILTEHKTIDTSRFDSFIEQLIEQDGLAVIDNGAATFVPLLGYITEIDLFNIFVDSDIEVFIHVPVVGGQAFEETLTGLGNICQLGNSFKIIAWLNEFQGDIERHGKDFTDFKIIQQNKDKVIGQVTLQNRNPDTFGKDIRRMTEDSITFTEVLESKNYTLIPKQRLKQVRDEVYRQLDVIFPPVKVIEMNNNQTAKA